MTISQGMLKRKLFYNPQTGLFVRLTSEGGTKEGTVIGSPRKDGYVMVSVGSKMYLAHRLAWLYVHGEMPDMLDHINGMRDDNRLENLRICSRSENAMNSGLRKDNLSGSRGVDWIPSKRLWRARITYNTIRKHLGYFVSKEKAEAAYETELRQLRGEEHETSKGRPPTVPLGKVPGPKGPRQTSGESDED